MQTTLILSALAPALVAVLLLAVGHQVWRAGPSRGGQWSLAIAPPVGAIVAYTVVREVPALPPTDASVWALWMSLAAAAVNILESRLGRSWAVRGAGALIASAATAWLVSKPLIANTWTSTEAVTWIGGAALVLALLWVGLDARAERLCGPAVPVALASLCGGAAAVLGSSGTALLAQSAAGAGAALGVAVLLSLWRPDVTARAAVGPTVILLGGCILAGIHFAEVRLASAVPLAIGALIIGLVPLPGVKTAGPTLASGWRAAVSFGLAGIIASGAAVGLSLTGAAVVAEEPAEAEDSDEDYGYD